jgi:hypothetical protein
LAGFGANHRFILWRRNIFVPTAAKPPKCARIERIRGVAERNFEISSFIGTYLFLSGRFIIHLHQFEAGFDPISVQISALFFAVGTFLFLSGRFTIHLHQFEPTWPGFSANLHFILGCRNIFVPIGAIYHPFAPIWRIFAPIRPTRERLMHGFAPAKPG